jgi:glucose-6-phosphate 1-dehydrogenase
LNEFLTAKEQQEFKAEKANRLWYLALPPEAFIEAATAIRRGGVSTSGWNRLIVEKPFGKDLDSSRLLSEGLSEVWPEEDTFRIDHYLGKEMVQNLMVLRFANSVWEPLWNRHHIKCVKITFKENFGTDGRGEYFDKSGIIRDIIQNHLMQIFSLVAMEPPVSLNAEYIRDEKVKLLRSTPPLTMSNVIVGQYVGDSKGNPGYLDDKTVNPKSVTPTFAQCVLYINNSRWMGVPFIFKAAKAVDERKADIRIQFHPHPANLFTGSSENELVMRVQPNEAIWLKQMTKVPGLSSDMAVKYMDLSYGTQFQGSYNPDAYERLILEAIKGSSNLFVREDELDAAWEIFTPILKQIDEDKIKPYPYTFGSRGPKEADEFLKNLGYNYTLGSKM